MVLEICDGCGETFEGDPCPHCGRPAAERGDLRRLPAEVVVAFVEHAHAFLAAGPWRQAVLAVAAGSFIGFGAMLSVVLTVGVDVPGVASLLLGLGFAAGFALVILSGSALFTEVNVLLPELFLSGRGPRLRLFRFWVIVYVGNLVGAIFVGFMLNAADVIGPAQGERLAELIGEKMRFEQLGAEGWLRVVASGILANWLVGMAAFLATAARTVSGKILGIALPILAFVALGVQHVPANMGYFAAGLIHGGTGTTVPEAFVSNLLPATIGNLIGGAVLVSLLFWYVFGEGAKRASLARANDHIQTTRPHG